MPDKITPELCNELHRQFDVPDHTISAVIILAQLPDGVSVLSTNCCMEHTAKALNQTASDILSRIHAGEN